ncbi:MAG: ferritin-like domain-containing protein [Candidatus Thioglobus sp.]|nr:ferritin-like domain-containing protein [Candidatus Thioglobus pontius]MBL6976823.1 ferritin-like domain-containing protein [Candidatus Thioglobus sp.]MBL6984312.1 ferritin-like domain-containing protein [Candidatus Thioglobus sp.]
MNPFELSYQALMCDNVVDKIKHVDQLHQLKNLNKLDYQLTHPIKPVKHPGRPNKPTLARFNTMPKRGKSDLGFIETIHAICHIEFNAINLALDAVYRFHGMPSQFYQDWIKVAYEEAQHFQLLNNYLIELGYQYGDFDAHNGLWKMTVETDYDVLARMALVPRVLEAKGLDATPKIQRRFASSKFKPMVSLLDIIFKDEIGHVKIGNHWFHHLCRERQLDPVKTFDNLIHKHLGESLRGPFNLDARKCADFTEQELAYLQAEQPN